LKGFGPDIDTAPVRRARLEEEIHVLALRETVAGVITSLIRAGRMAAREIVQTEAEVANRELALIESENNLQSANAALIDILDIDGVSRVLPSNRLAMKPVHPDPERSFQTALARRPDHLKALLSLETAKIGLRQAKNDLFWDLSLNAAVRGGSRADRSVGVTLTIPFGEDFAPRWRSSASPSASLR